MSAAHLEVLRRLLRLALQLRKYPVPLSLEEPEEVGCELLGWSGQALFRRVLSGCMQGCG